MSSAAPPETIAFVTGRLAEASLRKQVTSLGEKFNFTPRVVVLPITVAALMSPGWIARQLRLPNEVRRVILPGYCTGDLGPLHAAFPDCMFEIGPHDLRRLPEHFGQKRQRDASYGDYSLEIFAEINHAPRLSREELLRQALALRADGADVIDLGCIPGYFWNEVRDAVRMLRDAGIRVSIDSFDAVEVQLATREGAELVLSVNGGNREPAVDWGCEVVVIPDDFATLGGLAETIDYLAARNVPLRIDPILEPIGCGFAASLGRYIKVRADYPDAEMFMGIGNITELTDADSAGVNVILLGICEELGIRGVLTTQVINWARTSVKECDLARRLVHYAIRHGLPPKHLEPRLVLLRDGKTPEFGEEMFTSLASQIKDHNYRLFAERGEVHLVSAGLHLHNSDPFALFDQLLHPERSPHSSRLPPSNMNASHAFYLGYEMAKAQLALQLSKEYKQDESLDWGYLTQQEDRHRLKLSGSHAPPREGNEDEP